MPRFALEDRIEAPKAQPLVPEALLVGIVDVLLADIGDLSPRDHVNASRIASRIARNNYAGLLALLTRAAVALTPRIIASMKAMLEETELKSVLEMKPTAAETKLVTILRRCVHFFCLLSSFVTHLFFCLHISVFSAQVRLVASRVSVVCVPRDAFSRPSSRAPQLRFIVHPATARCQRVRAPARRLTSSFLLVLLLLVSPSAQRLRDQGRRVAPRADGWANKDARAPDAGRTRRLARRGGAP